MSDIALELKPIRGQDFTVTDDALGAITLIAYEGRINFRPNVATKDRRYYYAPYLAFLKEVEDDDIDVTVLDDVLPDGKVLIVLKIQWDRKDIPSIVRQYLIKEGFVDPTISAGQIQPLSLAHLLIDTSDFDPKVTFFDQQKPVINTSTIPMSGVVGSREIADRLVRNLKEGNLKLRASFLFDGAAVQQNTIIVDVQDILNTISAKNLDGAGVKTVTRDQIADVSQEALRLTKLKKQTEFTEDDVSELTATLLATLTAQVTDLAGDLSKLSAEFINLGFSPLDFRADLIRRSETKQNDRFHQTFSDKLREVQKDDDTSFSLFTNFDDVLDIGFDDKDKYRDYARELYSEVLAEKSVEVSFEGERIVPRSITIRRVDKTQLVVGSTITIESSRLVGGDQPGSLFMSVPDNVLNLKARSTFEERLSELAKGVVPVGTIVAFAGEKVPENLELEKYLLCDGKPLRADEFPALFDVIGTAHGEGVDDNGQKAGDFNLPDYRGMFLRGVDSSGRNDPDVVSRTAPKAGGNDSGKVGSIQPDAVRSHEHRTTVTYPEYKLERGSMDATGDGSGGWRTQGQGTDRTVTSRPTVPSQSFTSDTPGQGQETRPKNAYVNYIIKAK